MTAHHSYSHCNSTSAEVEVEMEDDYCCVVHKPQIPIRLLSEEVRSYFDFEDKEVERQEGGLILDIDCASFAL